MKKKYFGWLELFQGDEMIEKLDLATVALVKMKTNKMSNNFLNKNNFMKMQKKIRNVKAKSLSLDESKLNLLIHSEDQSLHEEDLILDISNASFFFRLSLSLTKRRKSQPHWKDF